MMPERIQRKRTKGWQTPEGPVYVGCPAMMPITEHGTVSLKVGEELAPMKVANAGLQAQRIKIQETKSGEEWKRT